MVVAMRFACRSTTTRRRCASAVHRSAARGCLSSSSSSVTVVATLIAFSLAAVRRWVARLISVFTGHRGRPEQWPRRLNFSWARGEALTELSPTHPPTIPQLTLCNFFRTDCKQYCKIALFHPACIF